MVISSRPSINFLSSLKLIVTDCRWGNEPTVTCVTSSCLNTWRQKKSSNGTALFWGCIICFITFLSCIRMYRWISSKSCNVRYSWMKHRISDYLFIKNIRECVNWYIYIYIYIYIQYIYIYTENNMDCNILFIIFYIYFIKLLLLKQYFIIVYFVLFSILHKCIHFTKLEHLPVDYTQCNNMNNTTDTMNMHFHHNTLTHKLIFVAEIQSHTKDLTIAIHTIEW